MLDDAYLVHGLNALSRAHETNYFTDGHRGAAVIAAYFLCRELARDPAREGKMEEGAADVIRAMIDAHWTHSPLCAPLPEEEPRPELVTRIVETMQKNIFGLRQAGHNVILPTMALDAFRQRPETVTPTRVNGICKLIEAFTKVEDIHLREDNDRPNWDKPSDIAEFVLSELLRTIEAFEGRGQGWSGHLLTYARALLDLRELGYGGLARQGDRGLQLYIQRIRMGPLETDKPRPEHPPSDLRPHQRAYWEKRAERPIGIGHCFKYPYGYYGLLRLVGEGRLKRQCIQAAYHIL
jgi:hypothetical protein